jgi:hypothetical protein
MVILAYAISHLMGFGCVWNDSFTRTWSSENRENDETMNIQDTPIFMDIRVHYLDRW